MKLNPFRLSTVLLCLTSSLTAHAEIQLPALFSDHMVLQQDAAVAVWGWAEAGEQVVISIGDQTKTVIAAAGGKWQVMLDPLESRVPLEMTIQGKNTIKVKDVLLGEVWLCAGQSNMAMPVRDAKNFEQEQAAAELPKLRMFTVASGRASAPQADCSGSWVVCAPATVGEFSATAYFFGRELQRVNNAAVGLIHSSRGGTLIESWLDEETQRNSPELRDYFLRHAERLAAFDPTAAAANYRQLISKWEAACEQAKRDNKPLPARPSDPISTHENINDVGGLFRGKIAPLIPYALRGVVWYQGESNTTPERDLYYETQLRLLVRDWRTRWGRELPFAWVQLPNVKRTESWAVVREAQLKALDLPHTGMAVAIDLGESRNLHPVNKQDVGKRLAQWALGAVYEQEVAVSGPLPTGHDVRDGEIVLRFRHVDGGLFAKGGDLQGFLVAGTNRAWKPARARIEGHTVIVSSPRVKNPVAVRYAWAADPVCNLYNGAGLPASPFRTDDWNPYSEKAKP